MAGNSVRPASIGVGPALRRAREIAGITPDEAARDNVAATIDGVGQPTTQLGPGGSISYSAVQDLTVSVSDGGAIRIVVDGRTLGVPGSAGRPWSETFVASGAAAEPSP